MLNALDYYILYNVYFVTWNSRNRAKLSCNARAKLEIPKVRLNKTRNVIKQF